MVARWEQLKQAGENGPGPRSSHCMAYADGHIYLFGGEFQPRVPVPAETYSYNLASGTWTKLETAGQCPGARVAATMATIGTRIYLFGGRTGIDMVEGATHDLYVLDTATSTWSAVDLSSSGPSCLAPPPRSYHAMAAAAGKLYVFGGCGGAGRLNDLWEFDPACSSWRQLPSCESVGPRGGSVLVAAADGSKLFVLGGFNGGEMSDCHSYDIASATWSCPSCCSTDNTAAAAVRHTTDHISTLSMPLARSVFGAAVHAGCANGNDTTATSCIHTGHIIAFGGEVAPSDKGHAGAGNFCAATYCLSPPGQSCSAACKQAVAPATTNTSSSCAAVGGHSGWHVLDTAADDGGPGPRGWFAAAVVPGGDLVVHGGLGADNSRLGDMYRLRMH